MQLWKLLVSSRDEVLRAIVAKLATTDEVPQEAPAPLVGLLGQLISSLHALDSGGNATLLPEGRGLASSIGKTSATDGRRIGEVIADLLAVHEAILDVAGEHLPSITLAEHRVLTRGISRAVASAVDGYAATRDLEVERAHAEHFVFLAHELRSPLSNIRMGVDLLDRGHEPSTLFPRIRGSVRRMSDLLDNEISSARLSAGSVAQLETLDLSRLLEGIVDETQLQARDCGVQLHLERPPILELLGDPRLLRSIFTNLLGNALKFSHRGGTVRVTCRHGAGQAVCEVSDACGGIPEDKLDGLFDAYAQADENRSGFGLGLAIVAEAVRRHGGVVGVDNHPGRGCTMRVTLPLSLP